MTDPVLAQQWNCDVVTHLFHFGMHHMGFADRASYISWVECPGGCGCGGRRGLPCWYCDPDAHRAAVVAREAEKAA